MLRCVPSASDTVRKTRAHHAFAVCGTCSIKSGCLSGSCFFFFFFYTLFFNKGPQVRRAAGGRPASAGSFFFFFFLPSFFIYLVLPVSVACILPVIHLSRFLSVCTISTFPTCPSSQIVPQVYTSLAGQGRRSSLRLYTERPTTATTNTHQAHCKPISFRHIALEALRLV